MSKRRNYNRVNKSVKTNKENDAIVVVKPQRFSAKGDSDYLHAVQKTLKIFSEAPDYPARLANQGYDEAQIAILNAALTAAQESAEAYLAVRQQRMARVNKCQESFKTLMVHFSNLTARIRKIYGGDVELLKMLGLDKPRQKTYGSFVDQAVHFYKKAMGSDEVRAKLEALGITASMLQASFDELEGFRTVWTECEKLKGDCQRLVEIRDANMKKLRQLMGAFILACRLEFKDTPQALETLGIFARNAAPKKKGDTEPAVDPGTTDPGTTDPGTGDPGTGTTEPGTGTTEPARENRIA